jgi:hypothetical protein
MLKRRMTKYWHGECRKGAWQNINMRIADVEHGTAESLTEGWWDFYRSRQNIEQNCPIITVCNIVILEKIPFPTGSSRESKRLIAPKVPEAAHSLFSD